eukprot:TRINITY_DN1272_c0_g1_i1.p3 TRINITY_DN1272_c0_g1~~TRINITY_DN1272_c0_g1_i1.p3  ORF type:complete len:182 (+),score=9.80 TRINITY_DN1272_c0_g1_i1:143-688(+)
MYGIGAFKKSVLYAPKKLMNLPSRDRVSVVRSATETKQNLTPKLVQFGDIQKMHVLQLISASVESQENLQAFESYAGRCAMLGVTVAMASEFLTDVSFFPAFNSTELLVFLVFTVLCLVTGVSVALLSRNGKKGRKFYSLVLASLVSASQNGINNDFIDTTVDKVLRNVFHKSMFVSEELI